MPFELFKKVSVFRLRIGSLSIFFRHCFHQAITMLGFESSYHSGYDVIK